MKIRLSGNLHARGLARAYEAGRQRIKKINEDLARLAFCEQLCAAWESREVALSEVEVDFLLRMTTGTDERIPNLHPGDVNICDSLRRKYEQLL